MSIVLRNIYLGKHFFILPNFNLSYFALYLKDSIVDVNSIEIYNEYRFPKYTSLNLFLHISYFSYL